MLGYGGFAISITPFFSSYMLTFVQRYGAILAVANIRGGGEFGERWHEGGMRENKVWQIHSSVLETICIDASSQPSDQLLR